MTATAAPEVAAAPATRAVRRDIAVLRVAAIVGVALIHVSGLSVINTRITGSRVWWTAQVLNGTSRYCVPLFIMVSGALILKPGTVEPLRDFYRRRLDRLVPALVVWHVVYIAFNAHVLNIHRERLTTVALLLTGRTYTALYFFWIILGLYLLTPALRKVVVGVSREGLVALGLALVALTCAWQTTVAFVHAHSTIDVSSNPTVWSYWVPYVGYFVLGAALAQLRIPRRTALPAGATFVVLSLVTVMQRAGKAPFLLNELSPASYNGWIVAASTVALFLLACALLPATQGAPGPLMRLVQVLANLTLGVFAMHLMVLYWLQHAGLFTVTKGASRLLELGYLIAATLAISFALAWVMSRVPVLRRLV